MVYIQLTGHGQQMEQPASLHSTCRHSTAAARRRRSACCATPSFTPGQADRGRSHDPPRDLGIG